MDQNVRVVGACVVTAMVALVAACSTSSENADSAAGSSDGSSGSSGASGTPGSSGSSGGGQPCTTDAQCPSHVCNIGAGVCAAATCSDGATNGAETDVDCGGGGACKACDPGKRCSVASDCTSGVCKDAGDGNGVVCQAPSSTDGVKNGNETGVDCGGPGNPKCDDGQGCVGRSDCNSDVCIGGKCATPICNDSSQNGTETDVDCGGPDCPRCADLLKCKTADDCKSGVCADTGAGLQCQPPSPNDHVQNGTETDVDCGGGAPGTPACATGLKCLAASDCTSQGCDYNKKCALGRSCTQHWGGDTCGYGGDGSLGPAQWESCCSVAPVVPATGPTSGKTVQLGKYPVTAGRMRAFLESISYNVRGFVQQKRDVEGTMPTLPGTPGKFVLDPNWDLYLPTSFLGNTDPGELSDCSQGGTCNNANGECGPSKTCLAGTQQAGIYTSIYNHLGGNIFKNNNQSATGCYIGSPGTHSFLFPADHRDSSVAPDFTQDIYDSKTLNCVDYLVAQAFCVWDGGRLELVDEWLGAWGPGSLPWSAMDTRPPFAVGSNSFYGCRFPWATDANHPDCGLNFGVSNTIEFADYQYSYEYPKQKFLPNGNPTGDYIQFLTAPGRTRGRGPNGHADVIGAGFEITSTVTWNVSPLDARHSWTGNGSWEVHGYAKAGGYPSELLNKYGKLGMRCAYPSGLP